MEYSFQDLKSQIKFLKDFLLEIRDDSYSFEQIIEFFVRKSSKIGVLINFMKEKQEIQNKKFFEKEIKLFFKFD